MSVFCDQSDMVLFSRIKIAFLVVFFLGECTYANNVWEENITIDGYFVEHLCEYNNKRSSDYYAEMVEWKYSGTFKYLIKLQSKYRMFTNYNHYSDEGLSISTDLHKVNPRQINFHSRADVEIYLNKDEFDKLIQANVFFVYYPSSIFDENWKRKLLDNSAKSNAHTELNGGSTESDSDVFRTISVPVPAEYVHDVDSRLLFFSHLSSNGFDQIRKKCSETIEAQKIAFDAQKEEANKPVNRLKDFFGVD